MPITDSVLSIQQELILKAAFEGPSLYSRISSVNLGRLASLPCGTVKELFAAVTDDYYDHARLYSDVGTKQYYVVGIHRGVALAITPALGTATKNKPFQLAPSIIHIAARKATELPVTMRRVAQEERFSLFLAACVAMLGILVGVFGEGNLEPFWLLPVSSVVLAMYVLLFIPRRNMNLRERVGVALAEEWLSANPVVT